MRKTFVAALAATLAFAGASQAASSVTLTETSTDAFVLNLDIDDATDVDTVTVIVNGSLVTSPDTTASEFPVSPAADTGFNALLLAPTFFGGFGLTEFGYTDNGTELSGTYAAIGGLWPTTPVDVASIVLQAGTTATYTVELRRGGPVVESLTGTFPSIVNPVVPEPTSVLAFAGLLGLGIVRRR